jgi:dTDP-4-amino-4,6-dideoxygalactose transaminase
LPLVQAIPHIDVKAQYAPLLPELKDRIAEVLEGGKFILGPNVEAFEREAADYLGVPMTIGCGNGTDAISLALQALEIGAGDEVICPAFTFYATAEPVARAGATPVFADIDPATLNLDPEDVAAKITPRTKAIMPVHLFGRPAPLAELAALDVPLIEDAAQAFGAPGIATTGVVTTFSFYPTKNLLGLGELVELPRDDPGHVYHLYCVRTPERDAIRAALQESGIGHAVHYTTPLHLQPVFRGLGYKEGDLPETERAARENLCLPLWPAISGEQQERVVETVRTAARVAVP